jgi:transposase-like protein
MEYFNRYEDGVVWRCSNNACRRYQSVRGGSFFAASHLPLATQIRLIILFVSEGTAKSAAKLLDISRQTVSNYFMECRRMYAAELAANPITFTHGGEYEADECLIKQVKVGAHVLDVVWVQSILERHTGKVFLHRILNRSRPSMVPPIQQRVPAHSVVFTDEHASYGNLGHIGYHHASVNHSQGEYQRWGVVAGVNRNIHINGCEGINSLIRRWLTYKSRRTIDNLDLVLSEIMYRKSGRSLFDPFK